MNVGLHFLEEVLSSLTLYLLTIEVADMIVQFAGPYAEIVGN